MEESAGIDLLDIPSAFLWRLPFEPALVLFGASLELNEMGYLSVYIFVINIFIMQMQSLSLVLLGSIDASTVVSLSSCPQLQRHSCRGLTVRRHQL